MLQKAKSSCFTLDTLLGSLELVVGYKKWKNLSNSKHYGNGRRFYFCEMVL